MFPRNVFKLTRQFNVKNANFLLPSAARCQSTSSKDLVLVDVNDKTGIATLTMNSLPVNSLNLEMLTAFSKGLDLVGSNGSKGMILTSVSLLCHSYRSYLDLYKIFLGFQDSFLRRN
jgi:hypothetical protein